MKTKEAIERVRNRFDKWALDEEDLAALQALGLVSIASEDERIRKELLEEIEFISPRDGETDGEGLILPSYHARIDRYKSYLEKQKEQKPESCDCSRDEESYTNGIHHVLMNPEAYGLIKQKPAEQLGGTFTSYDIAKTFTEGQNYVIAHSEKFGLCKPAEWSEEEERHLYNAIEAVKYVYDVSEGTGGFKCVEFLKSLRPQWKPSKKQIDALARATNRCIGVDDAKILVKLLEQLEKL